MHFPMSKLGEKRAIMNVKQDGSTNPPWKGRPTALVALINHTLLIGLQGNTCSQNHANGMPRPRRERRQPERKTWARERKKILATWKNWKRQREGESQRSRQVHLLATTIRVTHSIGKYSMCISMKTCWGKNVTDVISLQIPRGSGMAGVARDCWGVWSEEIKYTKNLPLFISDREGKTYV